MFNKNTIVNALPKLPDSPGVYLFYNDHNELIYVGKASSLKNRVKSYFQGQRTPRPIEGMIHEVTEIRWEETDSVLEAIILEANMIKKHQPKYNVLGKDDKSWNYIVITKDLFPKVETVRQHDLSVIASGAKQSPDLRSLNFEGSPRQLQLPRDDRFSYVFGPYPGLNTKAALKLLRKLFRFSNCLPPPPSVPPRTGGEKPSRPCLYYQMGQCPGICAGEITAPEYKQKIIRPLVTFLQGKKKQVIRMLEKQMKASVKDERYEEAGRLRDQLRALYRIQDIALLNKSFFEGDGGERDKVKGERGARVEGYDISNLGSTEKVGSMVVFLDDEPAKSEYRKFIVKTVAGQSDVDSLAEVLERRLRHPEWPLPQVFLIDGGRPQVNKARAVLERRKIAIPVVGIAKGPARKKNEFILGNKERQFIAWVHSHQHLLIKVRDEAHRFAITFHRARRSKRSLRQ